MHPISVEPGKWQRIGPRTLSYIIDNSSGGGILVSAEGTEFDSPDASAKKVAPDVSLGQSTLISKSSGTGYLWVGANDKNVSGHWDIVSK